jgi:hypothetical protein
MESKPAYEAPLTAKSGFNCRALEAYSPKPISLIRRPSPLVALKESGLFAALAARGDGQRAYRKIFFWRDYGEIGKA